MTNCVISYVAFTQFLNTALNNGSSITTDGIVGTCIYFCLLHYYSSLKCAISL